MVQSIGKLLVLINPYTIRGKINRLIFTSHLFLKLLRSLPSHSRRLKKLEFQLFSETLSQPTIFHLPAKQQRTHRQPNTSNLKVFSKSITTPMEQEEATMKSWQEVHSQIQELLISFMIKSVLKLYIGLQKKLCSFRKQLLNIKRLVFLLLCLLGKNMDQDLQEIGLPKALTYLAFVL